MKFLKIFQIFNWKTWKNKEKTKKIFRGRPASWKRSPDALNLFPDAISEGFLSSSYCRWNAFKILPSGFGWGSGRRPAGVGRRFSGVCFVSENWFWIHKSASFYWISWGRACQNWCRIVIFRDRHFPKKCQKIKILKNEISENFSNF